MSIGREFRVHPPSRGRSRPERIDGSARDHYAAADYDLRHSYRSPRSKSRGAMSQLHARSTEISIQWRRLRLSMSDTSVRSLIKVIICIPPCTVYSVTGGATIRL
jgi:hypothetical protein